MEYINLSDKALNTDIDKKGLRKLIILPDHSPGKGKLPVGSVAVYSKKNHTPSAKYLGPDIGCGMLLAKLTKPIKDFKHSIYNIANELRISRGDLGSLGGGNHFINIYEVLESEMPKLNKEDQVVLIHSGSRLKGKDIFEKRLSGDEYLHQYKLAHDFGKRNRKRLLEIVEHCTNNKTEKILESIHNSVEVNKDNVIYRKGAMKLKNHDWGIIPSSIGEDAIIVKAKPSLEELEWSMCHGTGRKISRREAKEIDFDSSELRKKIYIPNFIYDDMIKTEAPYCYRTINELIPLIKNNVWVNGKLTQLAFVN